MRGQVAAGPGRHSIVQTGLSSKLGIVRAWPRGTPETDPLLSFFKAERWKDARWLQGHEPKTGKELICWLPADQLLTKKMDTSSGSPRRAERHARSEPIFEDTKKDEELMLAGSGDANRRLSVEPGEELICWLPVDQLLR